MSATPRPTAFTPYGAYALKATYQRNLSLAMLTTVCLVVLLCLTGWLVVANAAPSDKPGGGSRTISIPTDGRTTFDDSKINVIHDQPPVSATSIAPPETVQGGIPVPVPDNQLSDDNDVVLPDRDELIGLVDLGNPGGFGSEGDGAAVTIVEEEVIPRRTDFVSCEIYPEMVYQAEPEYPSQALRLKQEGVVYVQALIDKEGGVRDAVVFKSSGVDCLDTAALRAALKNKFKPGIQNGRPVMVWVTYKVEFKLSNN